MSYPLVVELTVYANDSAELQRASETLHRMQVGLAMEGMVTGVLMRNADVEMDDIVMLPDNEDEES